MGGGCDFHPPLKIEGEMLGLVEGSMESWNNRFRVIGFDTHSYSNADIEKHEMRLELGLELDS